MAPGERRDGPKAGGQDFDGRDLLVGLPEGAEAPAPGAEESQTPPPAAVTSPSKSSPPSGARDDAHDGAIAEILATVRATAARLDALQDASGPEHETSEALAGERPGSIPTLVRMRGVTANAL